MTSPRLLTGAQVERFYGIPSALLARWRSEGRGPRFVAAGRRRFYRPEDIDAWLNDRVVQTTLEARQIEA